MKLEDAIKKSIKKYFQGVDLENLKGASEKKMKYDKKYFDGMAKKFDIKNYGDE